MLKSGGEGLVCQSSLIPSATVAKPRIISLFTGAGGLDVAFEAAGFMTAVALEFDHDCCETLRLNRCWPVIERDVFDVPTAELLEVGGLKRGDPDLLIGGPPCQPFSKSGYWRRGDALRLEIREQIPSALTFAPFVHTLPRAFLLENVEGLAYTGKDEGLRLLLGTIQKINVETKSNYRPQLAVLNAATFGVPQLRERVFIVASRDGTSFEFPRPTHADLDGEPAARDLFQTTSGLEPYRTAWDAIGDIRPPADEELDVRGRWAGLLPSIPEGHNYLWHTDRMGGMPLFRLAPPLLELSTEASEATPVMDDSGSARTRGRSFSLEEPAAEHASALPDPDVPR